MRASAKTAKGRKTPRSVGHARSRRTRLIGCLSLGAALALLTACVLISTVLYADSRQALRAYEHASPCPATARPGNGCLRYVTATVTRVQIDKGKASYYGVTLTGPAVVAGRLRLTDADPVLSRLTVGDRVNVEVWRGRRTKIIASGRPQGTAESPLDAPPFLLSLSVAIGLLGVLASDVAARHLSGRLHRRWVESGRGFSAVDRALGTSALTALVAGAVLASIQEAAPEAFFLLWATGLALISGVAVVRRRRN